MFLHLVGLVQWQIVLNSIWWDFSTVMMREWVREREKVISSVYFNKTLLKKLTAVETRGKPGANAKSSQCLLSLLCCYFFLFHFLEGKTLVCSFLLVSHLSFALTRNSQSWGFLIETTGLPVKIRWTTVNVSANLRGCSLPAKASKPCCSLFILYGVWERVCFMFPFFC